jgi:hypothetical protein
MAVGGPQLASNHLHQQHVAAGLHQLGPHTQSPLPPTNPNQFPHQQQSQQQQQALHLQQLQQRRPLLLQVRKSLINVLEISKCLETFIDIQALPFPALLGDYFIFRPS